MQKIVKALMLSSTLSFAPLLLSGAAVAGVGEKGHIDGPKKDTPHMEAAMRADSFQGMASGGHAHEKWVTPPADYAKKKNPDWADPAAATRGMALFAQQCAQCHGLSGRGDGPVAKVLAHKPADLSQHLHTKKGISDGYLFWRVSEGGMVEPFKSANSTMPAFKESLDEQQRWDVLTYIHQEIHKGFKLGKTEAHTDAPETAKSADDTKKSGAHK